MISVNSIRTPTKTRTYSLFWCNHRHCNITLLHIHRCLTFVQTLSEWESCKQKWLIWFCYFWNSFQSFALRTWQRLSAHTHSQTLLTHSSSLWSDQISNLYPIEYRYEWLLISFVATTFNFIYSLDNFIMIIKFSQYFSLSVGDLNSNKNRRKNLLHLVKYLVWIIFFLHFMKLLHAKHVD